MTDSAWAPDSSSEALVSQAADEFLDRIGRGESPQVEEYIARYPSVGEVLRGVLPALRAMHGDAPAQAPAAADDPAHAEGCLGDFRILGEIGRGGMGIVYEAEQISLRRRVALKVLPFAATFDGRRLERFKNEALAAARLHHSNIVPVYAVGCERGVYYYAMQRIDGMSLAEILGRLQQSPESTTEITSPPRSGTGAAESPLPASRAPSPACSETQTLAAAALSTVPAGDAAEYCRIIARLGIQAAEALEHAHGMDVIHRDIKPANLLVDACGDLWVTDFGLARLRSDGDLTMTGDIVGTYRYMSPEQALGERGVVDHRTDIYSLGATLYELLTLHPVFDAEGREPLLACVASRDPVPLRRLNRSVPADLETIVLKSLAKEPGERYASAAALAEDLRRFLENRPIRAKRPRVWERLNKWTRRHRIAVASCLVGLLLLALGLAVSNVLIARERARTRAAYEEMAEKQLATARALALENQQRQVAEATFRQARQMLDFVVQASLDDMTERAGDQDLRPMLLNATLEYYQSFIEQSRDNPPLQAELAASHLRVAKILEAIGSTPASRAALEHALENQERLVREHPEDEALRRGLWAMYFQLGVMRGGMSLMLIGHESVQKHLKLTPEQVERVEEITQQQEQMRRGFGDLSRTDPAQVRRELRQHLDAAQAALTEFLQPEQLQRLQQIVWQRQGVWALGTPQMADQLALTASQRSAIFTLQEAALRRHGNRERSEGPSLEEQINGLLTPQQRQVWKELLGPPYDSGRARRSWGPAPARTPATRPPQTPKPAPAR